MEPNNDQLLRETYRLAHENNKMLHAMRRNAFLAGIIKFIFYILILVVAPLWVYSNYLAPVVQSMEQTMKQIQGTNSQAQSEFSGFENALQQLQAKLPSFGAATSSQQ